MDEPNGITVRHTADRMKAFVSLSGAFGPVTAGAVLTELLHKGVVHGLNTAVIHKLVGLQLFDKFVEVAAGTVASPGADGRIEVLVSGFKPAAALAALVPGRQAKPVPLCDFLLVKAGAALVRRVPPVPGKDGMDIFGTPIPAPPVKDAELCGGAGTAQVPGDPDTLVAGYDGVFKFGTGSEAEVSRYMDVAGDLTKDISFEGTVKVGGAVHTGYAVDASGSLLIAGEVEGCVSLKCGGDLALRGDVRGSGLTIECGGSVQAVSLEGVNLTAGGGVTVSGGIEESIINAKGVVRARNISGGSVTAAGGIYASQVGSDSRPATILDVGVAYRYVTERDSAKGRISTQALLAEGYISELCCFVRDQMDSEGFIPPGAMSRYERHRQDLTASLAERRDLEKNVETLNSRLKEVAGCCIMAGEVHPNVALRLGFSEQHVREVLKNVCMKPSGIDG
ncbi:MAG: FapA family protein [Chitinispirillia bacterium]|nr:FapA family protein [Chitinispirillia bacterium]MCL2241969.1 FapA family protein [Chitinispirillia bacterium]